MFCGRPDTEWQHDLDRELVHFRTRFDRGRVWGSTQVLCDDCEQRYRGGDYLALARVTADLDGADGRAAIAGAGEDDQQSLVVQDELIALAAFCRADLRVRRLATPDFPAGFAPVDEYTGALWVTEVWPAEFCVSVAETRPGHLDQDPEARIWLLRSPWPALSLAETFAVLWTWAERDHGVSEDTMRARVVEALAWSEAQAAGWLARDEGPPRT